jgi:glycosyltransferase involved in cell wall biosynthesis
MSVFNGADHLDETLDSVLSQEGCDFELVVIDDGSTDETPHVLRERASRDARIRLFHQENRGLTQALVRGCAEARGDFIARQDAGDVSLPGRLASQANHLRANSETVLVACGTRFVGPANETLYEAVRPGDALGAGLSSLDVKTIAGPPHHGGTMFRKDAYLAVGGYRSVFAVAQDIDLWLRLAERGQVWGQDGICYLARLAPNSISTRRRHEQIGAGVLAIECAKARRIGRDDTTLLTDATEAGARGSSMTGRWDRSRFFYFIGACLSKTDPAAARRYFARAARENPLCLKALARRILG